MIIRAYHGPHIGATGFFRNRVLLDTVDECIDALYRSPPRVLFHAVSIGAEAYSFLIHRALRHPEMPCARPDATDIDAGFLCAAAEATYPAGVLQAMRADETRWFEPVGPNRVRVFDSIRRCVRFLPPASYVEFESEKTYDVVFLLNSLLYVHGPDQRRAIDRIASYNTGLLVTTGFHLDRIKADLSENGYFPVTKNLVAIHDGWAERRALAPEAMVPGVTHFTPSLPPFSPIADFEYKYCAVFAKASTLARLSAQQAGEKSVAEPGCARFTRPSRTLPAI